MSSARKAGLRAVFLLCAVAAAAGGGDPSEEKEEPFTPQEYAAAIRSTVSGATVHAAVGPAEIPLPLDASNFLLDHPDLSAFIVNRRKIAPYRIEMLGPRRSLADDGAGTRGVVNLIEATERHRLYYGEGVHRSLLFPDIRASAVIAMDLSETAGHGTATTFHVWVRIKNRFVSAVVKTLRPFLQGAVVGKFTKAFSVADAVGRLMAGDPEAISEDVRAYPGLFIEDRALILGMISRLRPSAARPGPRAR